MNINYFKEKLLRFLKWQYNYLKLSNWSFKSGTPKYPTAQDVIVSSINRLSEFGKIHDLVLYIEKRKWRGIFIIVRVMIRVHLYQGNYIVRIKFPRVYSPQKALEENIISVPESWIIKKIRKRWIVFDLERIHKETIAPFLISFYEIFYLEYKDYSLKAKINNIAC